MSELKEFREDAENYISTENCPAWITAGVTELFTQFDNNLIKESRLTTTIRSMVAGQDDSPFKTRRGYTLTTGAAVHLSVATEALPQIAAIIDANPSILTYLLPKASKARKASGELSYASGASVMEVWNTQMTKNAVIMDKEAQAEAN